MIPYQDFSKILPKTFNLYIKGCEHVGNEATTIKGIKKAVQIIADDPIGFWGSPGDNVEGINPHDKRFQLDIHAGKQAKLGQQIKEWIRLNVSILYRCLFIMDGNHEEVICQDDEPISNRITEKIKDTLGYDIVSGGRSIIARLTPYFKLYCTHGGGIVNSKAGDASQRENNDGIGIKRKLRDMGSDCIVRVMGHIHKIRICKPVHPLAIIHNGKLQSVYPDVFVSKEGVLHEDSCWFASSGSFVRAFIEGATTYVERYGYPPTELGMIKIVVVKGRVINVEKVIV